MGRGNICTHNDYEGLYYLDNCFIETYYNTNDASSETMTAKELDEEGIKYDFDGKQTGWAYDEDISRLNYEDMVEIVCEELLERFPSFYRCDAWRGDRNNRDKRVVLRNSLFDIAVADNEWSYAWLLLENEEARYDGRNAGLMARHWQTYLEAIKCVLVEIYGEAIGYGGAWLSGKKYTKEDVA